MTSATVRQFPETSRWILTVTFCLHAVNPSLTSTGPEVTRCLASRRETVRGWVGPSSVKLVVLVAVPPRAVTEIRPVVAPAGTVAVILVEELTTKDAVTLLKRTTVAPVKFVPVIVTEVPTRPEVGENEVMVGAATTVNLVELVAVPFRLVAEICVDEFTVKDAEVLLNLTPVTLVKFVPRMLTEVPAAPLMGENDVMVGAPATVTVKFVELVAAPLGLVRVMGPVKAPEGTMAEICVEEFTVNEAAAFLKLTPVTSMKFVPTIVTSVPTDPEVGENDVMVGGSAAAAGPATPTTSTLATARLRARRQPIRGLRALTAPPYVTCASFPALSVPQEGDPAHRPNGRNEDP